MLKMKNKYLLLFILFGSACQQYSESFIVDKSDFQITLPGFVQEEELAEDAELEYANRYRNFYIVVLKSKDSISRDSFWKITTNRIALSILEPKIDSVHKGQTIETKISGKFKDEKEPIFYTQKLVYQPGNSYLITVWTRGKERYEKYQGEIQQIMNSFKPKR